MSPKKKNTDLKYQDALAELEAIVNEVESDNMNIDRLSENIERALTLIHYCRSKLKATETQIQQAFENDPQNDNE